MKDNDTSKWDRVLADIKSGQNIDLYVSVVASIVLVILNLLSIIDSQYFVPVTMATIAILTYTIVGLKHDVIEVKEKLAPVIVRHPFTSDFPPEFQTQLDAAHDVWFSGTHLSSVLTAYHDLLLRKLQRGGRLRFLLVSPAGEAAIMASKRFPGTVPREQEKDRILTSLSILLKLKQSYPAQLEVRIIDFPIEYTTFFIDPGSPVAQMYVERATYKISGGIHKPKFVFTKSDGRWFEHVSEEIRLLWKDSEEWVSNTSP